MIQAPQIVNAAQNASGKEAKAQIAVTAIFSYSEAPLGAPRLLLINAILHAPLLAISKEGSFGHHYSTYGTRLTREKSIGCKKIYKILIFLFG